VVVIAAAGVFVGLLATGKTTGGPATTMRLRTDAAGRLHAFDVYYRDLIADHSDLVRRLSLTYKAWNGAKRTAYLIVPNWYSPRRAPSLPLVISPHGRGIEARDNLHFWGGLPAFGPFIVITPEGQGRVLTRYSWGWHGEVDDLARMPQILARAFPWLKIDRHRIYAAGSSMGGQETLLLVARYPHLLAGAAALDSDTDMRARYYAFAKLPGGPRLQSLARTEIGGTPTEVPHAYELRSPIFWAPAIARSGVPLHIWWSTKDRIVTDQRGESGRLFRAVRALKPRGPVTEYVGTWAHSHEFRASARLPLALLRLGLIRLSERIPQPDTITNEPAHAG
jgi:pimeloyl-ACP methyl ester carboxylesterase